MAGCFEEIENEDLNSCINSEIQAGLSEVGLYYAIHEQATAIPEPLSPGDEDYDFESAVTVTTDITFPVGKGFGKITLQTDTGELKLDLVGNKGNKKHKQQLMFSVPGNSKKLLGFIRTLKNTPLLFIATERDGQKRLVGDKNNPAYIMEAAGTTGKGGEDDKNVVFTIETYAKPIVYEGVITANVPPV